MKLRHSIFKRLSLYWANKRIDLRTLKARRPYAKKGK